MVKPFKKNSMKNFFYMICILSLFVEKSNAQSALETEFVKQLNIYRKKHGLGAVIYDAEISKVALYHANYLAKCVLLKHVVHYDKLPHDEQFDIKNHTELNFEQRAAMAPDKNIWGEIQISANYSKNTESISEVAKGIIVSFNGSPKHKEIMLCEDLSRGLINAVGVSIVKFQSTFDSNEYSVNIDFGVLIDK
jgi:uncharacterized protein YkwD